VKPPPYPVLHYILRVGDKTVRLFFRGGAVRDVVLPIRHRPRRIYMIQAGTAIKWGGPMEEMSSVTLWDLKPKQILVDAPAV
jgi:hypothetical protein